MILQLASIQQPNSCGIKLTFNAEFKTDELVFLDAHYRKKIGRPYIKLRGRGGCAPPPPKKRPGSVF